MTAHPQAKILLVGGSPRPNGNTDALLQSAAQGAEARGVPCTIVHLRDYQFSPCVGCEKCRKDKACTKLMDGMQLLYPLIEECRGIILASPTHHYNITAWMKAFIDRLYCYYDFTNDRPRGWSSRLAGQGRCAAVMAVCEQEDIRDMGFTLEAMEMPLQALLGCGMTARVSALLHFSKGAVKKDQQAMDAAFEAGKAVARQAASG
ncbi:flavodoxin family protein [Desulfatibacillum aliphaticivorans]|uniref:NADPH-dependent FMN reductase n=1 Tax=Desulfatibacillum aliphaticivorans TaxID=218208 RepID=B8FKJ6_DESAL|nr:flavodoxin family protein [Desulfatibacillum aliphaticivorans]ACL01811.1 NADPH-dependent FMN reductase [Desulfatibacillum aliphaticivorans]